MSAAGVSGTGGIASRGFSIFSDILLDQSTMLGSATSRFSFTLGGATMVCERLSASRGREMMGCRDKAGWGNACREDAGRDNSGFAFLGRAALSVSSGGRYSEAL